MSPKSTRGLVAFLVALCGVVGVLTAVAAPAPAAAADAITVTWPASTAFNPDAVYYVIDIQYSGPGRLKLHDPNHPYDDPVMTPTAGGYDVVFPEDGVWVLNLSVCEDGACSIVSTSPRLEVYSQIWVEANDGSLGPLDSAGSVWPRTSFDVAWSLRSWAGGTLASGSADGVQDHQLPPVDADVPTGTDVTYVADITIPSGPFAGLVQHVERAMTWDATPPLDAALVTGSYGTTENDGDTVYPLQDELTDYWDRLYFYVGPPGSDIGGADFVIRDSAGDVVASQYQPRWGSSMFIWDGQHEDGSPLPEGAYDVGVRVYDSAGNFTDLTRTVHVSHDVLALIDFHATIAADSTLMDKTVGRCASLRTPARPDLPGSLGYYSSAHCSDPNNWTVSTTNVAAVPTSPIGEYGYRHARITVNGGAAYGARPGYVTLQYLGREGLLLAKSRLTGGQGAHPATAVSARKTVRGESPMPGAIVWRMRGGNGSRFDVESFTIDMRYVGLVPG